MPVSAALTQEERKILESLRSYQQDLAPGRAVELPWVVNRLWRRPRSRCSEAPRVLDAACGGGFLQKVIESRGFEVTPTDFNRDAAWYSDGGERRPRFVLHDLRQDPLQEWLAHFHNILFISTAEHLDEGDDSLIVRNLIKCLSKNGRFFITTPYSPVVKMGTLGDKSERYYSLRAIQALLAPELELEELRVFTREEQGWPFAGTPDEGAGWKDILVASARAR